MLATFGHLYKDDSAIKAFTKSTNLSDWNSSPISEHN